MDDRKCVYEGGNDKCPFEKMGKTILILQAIVVLVVIFIAFKLISGGIVEKYTGRGLASNVQVYTSGATMRRLAQKFSSTNQGVYTTVHNAELKGFDRIPMRVVIFPVDKVPNNLITEA